MICKKSGETSACGSGNNQSSNCVTVTGNDSGEYPGPGWKGNDFSTSEYCDPEDSSTKNNVTKLCNMKLGLNRTDYYTPTTKPSCASNCSGINNAVQGTNCMWCGDEIIDGSENCEVVSNGIKYGNNSNEVFDLISLSKDFDSSTTWVVPISGTYEITVYGAEGGSGATGESGCATPGTGGKGAKGGKTVGNYNLTKGETLTLTIGTKGQDGSIRSGGLKGQTDGNPGIDGEDKTNDGGGGGGGGGSSSVKATRSSTVVTLIQAYGGGGGGGGEGSGDGPWCIGANDGKSGSDGSGSSGGSGGNGGASKGGDGGAGGSGGGSNICHSSYVVGTCSKTNGARTGNGYISIELKKYPPCNSCKFATNTSDYIAVKNRKAACTNLAEHAHWLNGTGQITQSYSTSWTPPTDGGHGSDSTKCYFQCDTNYNWESGGDPAVHSGWHCIHEKTAACTNLPSGAVWSSNNSTTKTITLTYSGADGSGSWGPSTTGDYNTSTTANQCYYKCDSTHTWEGGACINKRTRSCESVPAGAVPNTATSITQNWTAANGWKPSLTPSYNTTASTTECRYKCNTNYTWNSSTKKCVADKHTADCPTNTKPANTDWNTVSQITQEWNGSSWQPVAETVYNTTASTQYCRYKCSSGFHTENSGASCISNTRTHNCGTLPANAEWNSVSSYQQNWTGSAWNPADSTLTHNDTASTTSCRYKCKTHYPWNSSTEKCVAETRSANCNGALPTNATWNDSGFNHNGTGGTFTQTWDGAKFAPETVNSDYNSTAGKCKYKCKSGYDWIDSACKKVKWSFEDDGDDTSSGVISSVSGSGSYPWTRTTSYGANSGSYAMCSTNQSLNSTDSTMALTVNMPKAGNISFYVRGTSEKNYDYLTVGGWSSKGTDYDSWEKVTIFAFPGTTTFYFNYHKDSSAHSGIDTYCVDDVSIELLNTGDPKTWGFESNSWPTAWLSGSASSWALNSSYKHSGTYSYCSTNTGANSDGTLTLNLTASQAGLLQFYVYGQSEECCDNLNVNQNGSQVWTSKGSDYSSWTPITLSVSAGTTSFTFTYHKDGSVDGDIDKYCIDDLTFLPTN